MTDKFESHAAPNAEILSLLVANHRRFVAFLELRVRTPQDAEEILQSALAKTVAKDHKLTSDSAVAWFYSVLRNALTDYYRRQDVEKRALGHLQELAEVRGEAWEEELKATVCACVNELIPTLKGEYAELLRRVDLEGASVAATAAELGITANNAAVRLHRARIALRDRLQQTCRTCADHGCFDCSCKES